MRKVLIGTTNPSKFQRFRALLSEYDVEFCTPEDLNITSEPKECGKTPEENAVLKARHYSQYFDSVICNDSGLYLENLTLEDSRQPGLNIRTPGGIPRLNDEEMIAYYSKLIRSLGGKVLAYYLDGIAVCRGHKIYSFMEDNPTTRSDSFYMIDRPSPKRQPGWPLDSLSLYRDSLTYFVDDESDDSETADKEIMSDDYKKRLIYFLASSLDLQKKIIHSADTP